MLNCSSCFFLQLSKQLHKMIFLSSNIEHKTGFVYMKKYKNSASLKIKINLKYDGQSYLHKNVKCTLE